MKYYKIDIKRIFPELGRISSSSNGKNILNSNVFFDKMRKGEILYNTPIFDHFVLESFDKEEFWEWALFDVYDGIGDYPGNFNWYISENFKTLLEKYKVAPKFHFYETKLLYKGEKLKYWIFQFMASYRKLNKMNLIDFSKSTFSINSQNYKFNSYEDWSNENEAVYEEYNLDLQLNRVCLKHFFDFIPLSPIISDIICSENLKKAIEENEITGFEFAELDYEVVVEF
ncbi:imm11 family protein [Chryseobacterium jejuense]|uniref:imm11 family protein n=1 Tax=Chryseobacterium jejuense TaxID=445960 RepID=UPI001AE9C870|nr:DUF1629 domain-containing protein [Chryseobacterium jejuense]MBP2617888.1 hypothetical protein [Chryseobacterium jejuense]